MFGRLFQLTRSNAGAASARPSSNEVLQSRIANILNREQRTIAEPAAMPRSAIRDNDGGGQVETIALSLREPETPETQEPAITEPPEPAGEAETGGEPIEEILDDVGGRLNFILMSRQAMESDKPVAAVKLNSEIVEYLIAELHFDVDELPQDAYLAFAMDFYLHEALEGGHGQFASAAFDHPEICQAIGEGLGAIGALEYLKVFDDFNAMLAEDSERAERVRKNAGYGETDPAVEGLDNRFMKLIQEAPLVPKISSWLRSRPNLKVLDREALDDAINAIADHRKVSDGNEEEVRAGEEEDALADVEEHATAEHDETQDIIRPAVVASQ